MRLLMETGLKPAGGYIGAGTDGFRWPRPVRPGDELRVECEVIEVRQSRSRLDRGLIKLRLTTLNQDDEAVLTYVANMVVLRRAGQVTGETALSHGLGSVAGPEGTEVGGVTEGLDVVPDAAVVTGAVVEGDATQRVATDLEAAASVTHC
jgi:hypothetical protein